MFNDNIFAAISELKALGEKHNVNVLEIALRWIAHHSQLKAEHGDAVIIGASKVEQLEENLIALEGPALPQEIVDAADQVWQSLKPTARPYWH